MYAADRICVNTMEQALDICDRLDPNGTGALELAIGVCHAWRNYALYGQIERAGEARILAFHICDWLMPTRDLLLHRRMMGDGVAEIRRICAAVEAQGFSGYVEVEILPNYWWSRPIDDVIAIRIQRFDLAVWVFVGAAKPTGPVDRPLRGAG